MHEFGIKFHGRKLHFKCVAAYNRYVQLFVKEQFISELKTYQAMLWYSSKSIIFKNSKIALLEYFSTGTKIVGNHSKFYLSLMKTSGKHPVHF